MYWGQGCSADRNLEVHTSLLPYCTFGLRAVNDAHNLRADTARGKDNDQQNISKIIIWYRSVYNQIASDAWRYNNPVYKLMTDKLQLMIINVLLDQFLNIKVSHGNVATRLRCDRILNDQFIIQSLLSLTVKAFWKSVNICWSYGQLSTWLFFLWNTLYSTLSTRVSAQADFCALWTL